MYPSCRAILLAVVLGYCLWSITPCHCQGLARNPHASAAATNEMLSLQRVYAKSVAWRRAYAQAAAAKCSTHSGSLCAPSATAEERVQLLMATSPQTFDARTGMGTFSAVGAVKNQGTCAACVAFVVLAAAQSAVACALQEDASSQLSEQDFFFCKTVAHGEERSCTSSWTIAEAVQALVDVTNKKQYPLLERCMPNTFGAGASCQADCWDTLPALAKGTFKYTKLGAAWQVQVRCCCCCCCCCCYCCC
jgi:hypothetical protein